ncbi:hypothetical protein FRC16_001422, partial [Serendipita sp. 398]
MEASLPDAGSGSSLRPTRRTTFDPFAPLIDRGSNSSSPAQRSIGSEPRKALFDPFGNDIPALGESARSRFDFARRQNSLGASRDTPSLSPALHGAVPLRYGSNMGNNTLYNSGEIPQGTRQHGHWSNYHSDILTSNNQLHASSNNGHQFSAAFPLGMPAQPLYNELPPTPFDQVPMSDNMRELVRGFETPGIEGGNRQTDNGQISGLMHSQSIQFQGQHSGPLDSRGQMLPGNTLGNISAQRVTMKSPSNGSVSFSPFLPHQPSSSGAQVPHAPVDSSNNGTKEPTPPSVSSTLPNFAEPLPILQTAKAILSEPAVQPSSPATHAGPSGTQEEFPALPSSIVTSDTPNVKPSQPPAPSKPPAGPPAARKVTAPPKAPKIEQKKPILPPLSTSTMSKTSSLTDINQSSTPEATSAKADSKGKRSIHEIIATATTTPVTPASANPVHSKSGKQVESGNPKATASKQKEKESKANTTTPSTPSQPPELVEHAPILARQTKKSKPQQLPKKKHVITREESSGPKESTPSAEATPPQIPAAAQVPTITQIHHSPANTGTLLSQLQDRLDLHSLRFFNRSCLGSSEVAEYQPLVEALAALSASTQSLLYHDVSPTIDTAMATFQQLLSTLCTQGWTLTFLHLSAMLILSLLTVSLAIIRNVKAQCDNYGVQNGTVCDCPPGVGGPQCEFPTCGGTLFDVNRPVSRPQDGHLYGNSSSCTCPDGWTGFGCNVCQSSSSCSSAYTANFGSQTSTVGGQGLSDGAITCSKSLRVYGVGQMSCSVNNPTIGALYPGKTTLNIVRNLDSSKALAPDVTSFGPTKSVYAQLWYEGEEEFFCTAENCDANDGDTSSDWTCHDLKCNCRTNATFCGAIPATSIKNVIDTLKGDLQIKCSNQDDGTISCSFLQETINSVFGSAGLPMSNCQLGECVAQSVIDSTTNPTSTAASSTKSELSGGVVAGLAVVGVLILGFIAMFLWGWIVQRKARQSAGSTTIKSGGVTLRWSAINYSVPTSHSGLFKKSKANAVGERHILNDLYGEVRPGELLAILGPSGAGKSTLIDILGGKNKVGKTTGTVTFSSVNGASIKKPRIGFVDQQDILPSMLTVEEALLFAAKLRLPESITLEQKQARVFEVMKQLNILDLKDTRIGSHERRGISGGEQRRVSIGLELVAAPDILVLDEPTSGLDSVSANKVVSVLRDLAHDPTNPTAVIASVHQPNSKIYQLFDKVLVLSRGKELYFGMGGLAPGDHFATRGYPIQPGYNVADHLLDIASDPSEDLLEKSQRTSGSPTINQVTSDGRHPTNQNYSQTMVNEIDGSTDPEKGKPKEIEESHQTMPLGSPYLLASYTSTFLTQLQVLCGREWKILK